MEAAGAVATTNPGGAGKWLKEYSELLRGSEVRIVADRDKSGIDHARRVARSLEGIAASVEILQAGRGKDASDHLDAGLGLDELEPVQSAALPAFSYEDGTWEWSREDGVSIKGDACQCEQRGYDSGGRDCRQGPRGTWSTTPARISLQNGSANAFASRSRMPASAFQTEFYSPSNRASAIQGSQRKNGSDLLHGRAVELEDPAPYPDPVDGAQLPDSVAEWIEARVYLP